MKKATFENSVDVLVKAYMNDTLVHGNCYACAVGNLVAAANGFSYTDCVDRPRFKLALKENGGLYSEGRGGFWFDVACRGRYILAGEVERESIGYTWSEIVAIERAFEKADTIGDAMFNGLMAVVDVLAEIHGVNLSTKQQAVGQFQEVQLSKVGA